MSLPTTILQQKHFGVSLIDYAAQTQNALPRILVFLCEYLIERGTHVSEVGSEAVEEEIISWMSDPDVDSSALQAARERFQVGDFYDCRSPTIMFRLLKSFVRELPTPLLPLPTYDDCLRLAANHMANVVRDVRGNTHWRTVLERYQELPGGALDTWVQNMWTTGLGKPPPEEFAVAGEHIESLVDIIAFSVRDHLVDIEEFFFSLPKVNRQALEYLLVCLAKLDVLARKAKASAQTDTLRIPPVLDALANAFAPHLLKPNTWDARRNTSDRARRKQLQYVFVLILLYFIKRKHNIMTMAEREGMDEDRKECISALLLQHSSSSAKLSHAVASLSSQPSVQLIRELASFSNRTHSISSSQDSAPSSTVGSPMSHRRTPPVDSPLRRAGVHAHGSASASHASHASHAPHTPHSYTHHYGAAQIHGAQPDLHAGDDVCGVIRQDVAGNPVQVIVDLTPDDADVIDPFLAPRKKKVVACDWIRSVREKDRIDDVLEQSANLSEWLRSEFEPFDDESSLQRLLFAVDPLPTGSVYSSILARKGVPIEPSKAPGEGIIHLLGPAFDHKPEVDLKLDDVTVPLNMTQQNLIHAPPTTNAINYDYAMLFPRTLPDSGAEKNTTASVLDRFLSFISLSEGESPQLRPHKAQDSTACVKCSGKRASYCRLCEATLCRKCVGGQFLIPSYVLEHADFQTEDLCSDCLEVILQHLTKPFVPLDEASPAAVKALSLDRIMRLSQVASEKLWLCILAGEVCPSASQLLALVKNVWEFLPRPNTGRIRLSMNTLGSLHTPFPLNSLREAVDLLSSHTQSCTRCNAPMAFVPLSKADADDAMFMWATADHNWFASE